MHENYDANLVNFFLARNISRKNTLYQITYVWLVSFLCVTDANCLFLISKSKGSWLLVLKCRHEDVHKSDRKNNYKNCHCVNWFCWLQTFIFSSLRQLYLFICHKKVFYVQSACETKIFVWIKFIRPYIRRCKYNLR